MPDVVSPRHSSASQRRLCNYSDGDRGLGRREASPRPTDAAVFGEKLARALTINIAYHHASRDLRVLMHLDNLVNGLTASDAEFRDVVELVKRADQASYYIHIFLPEISRALQDFAVVKLDRETFRREALELLRLLANLDEVDVPYLCGSYLALWL
jgi:hypothetical protein